VDDEEINLLADHFSMPIDEFEKVYTRKVGRSRSLRDQANDNCIFFDDGAGCLVYEARPRQCRTWPFWEHNLETPQTWKDVQQKCPGSGKGELFTVEEITARFVQTRATKKIAKL
jgi:Fe-S-cluster containining protein